MLGRSVTGDIGQVEGPGTYEAHVSEEDIEQLREFIKARAPEEPPERREAVAVRQKVALGGPGLRHGAEFENSKGNPSEPRPFLAEKDRVPEFPPDQDCYGQ